MGRPGCAGLRGPWPGRLHPGDDIQVRWLRRRFCSAPSRLHLPDHNVLSFELVVPDPTSSVAVVWGSDIATIRLRIGLRTVGDLLVSSPSADSSANSATDCAAASHKTASTQRTSGSLQ